MDLDVPSRPSSSSEEVGRGSSPVVEQGPPSALAHAHTSESLVFLEKLKFLLSLCKHNILAVGLDSYCLCECAKNTRCFED